ncbi:hypothetical protein AAFO92_04335 [Roseovarius sp. CAU 1744]|uniref:hypothetical protein n=1 Tax=Roseovarius sp. CAU 1744 TaxID=3140368 RepID=UPI00325A6F27
MRNFLTEKRRVPPACFLILALPVLIFLLSDWLVPNLGVPMLDITADELLIDGKGYLEAGGRNRYLGALLFYSVLVVIAMVMFLGELAKPLTVQARVLAIAVLLLVQLPVLASVLGHQEEAIWSWRSYHQLGSDVMQQVLARGEVRRCQELVWEGGVPAYRTIPEKTLLLGRPCTENPTLALLRILLDYTSVMSGFGVAALVLGMILSLACPPASTPLEVRAFDHGRNQRAARRFLYLAGLMLSAGMFQQMSWMQWPMPLVDTATHPSYGETINATLFYYGVFYTLLIVTGFGPVMYLASRRSDELAMESLVKEESLPEAAADDLAPTVTRLEKWKATHGLQISMTEAIQALIATGSPLLTAFAGSFAPV